MVAHRVYPRTVTIVLSIISGGEGIADYRNFPDIRMLIWGPGYVSGIATSDGLDGPGIESRSRHHFPYPSGPAPAANPPSCTMGTVYDFRGKVAGVWR